MEYCILHYESKTRKEVYEYTLQAPTKSLLQDIVAEAVYKLKELGRYETFYFSNEEAMLKFKRGVFRF